jgi:uncharacterized small protein (DUF1192 family)
MPMPENLAGLSRDELLQVIVEQHRQIAELTARVEAVQAEVERLKRESQRQAAPFSKGGRVATPKKPGRKPGQGPFTHRAASRPEMVTEPPIEVPVLLPAWPVCVRQFRVAVSRCTACGQRVRGQPPELALDQ